MLPMGFKQLLEGTDGHIVIGINLRPLRHEWATGGEEYSKSVEIPDSCRGLRKR